MITLKRLSTIVIVSVMAISVTAALAQQDGPQRGSSEVGNFGDVPFANPQIIITRPEDRVKWRALEDKQLKERRDLEDRFEAEFRALRVRQAGEREALLKLLPR